MTIAESLQLMELTLPFTKAELNKAYCEAVMIWHPDRFPAHDELRAKAQKRTCLINEAFSVISQALEKGYDFNKAVIRPAKPRTVSSKETPQNAREFNKRGVEFHAKGRPNKAVDDFTEAIRLDPTVATYYRNRGVVYASRRKLDNAITDFAEAMRLDSSIRIDPVDACSFRARAAVYTKLGDYENAIQDLSEAIRLEPEVADAHFQRGVNYMKGGDYDNALLDIRDAKRLDPKKRKSCRNDFRKYGQLCESRKEYKKAVESYTFVIQSFREGTADSWGELVTDYFRRGRAYRLMGAFDLAIADFSKCVELFPGTQLKGFEVLVAVYYKCRAQVYYEKGDFRSAISDLTAAFQRDRKGRFVIIEDEPRFNGPDPNDEGWKHKDALGTLACLCARTGEFDRAVQYQKAYLELPYVTEEEARDGLRRLALYETHREEVSPYGQ